MSKKALVVKRDELFPKGNTEGRLLHVKAMDLLKLTPILMDRDVCETDNNFLQVIPYITLVDKETKEIFVYRRGKGSSETRLTGRVSIGVGGHIEETLAPHKDFHTLVVSEAIRELTEETGLAYTGDLAAALMFKLLANGAYIFYNNIDPVGSVHLAVGMFLGVDKANVSETEANIVSRGQWMSFDELYSKMQSKELDFEEWSQVMLNTYEALKE